MAHKRKKEVAKEEEYEFVPPEFDEKEFLENDIKGTKTLLLTTVFAIVCGIIAFLLGGVSALLGLVILIGGMVALRYLYLVIGIKPNEVEKKTMIGNLIVFFFLTLGIWILLVNPPFSDQTDPQVSEVSIWFQDSNGNWTKQLPTDFRFSVPSSGVINITAEVADNDRLSEVRISLQGGGTENMTNSAGSFFEFSDSYAVGSHTFYIIATDVHGHTTTSNVFTIQVTSG
ncbi:MAG: hypothetical protein FJ151_01065 [Euryarchaeota archaeon]|nr:hypothetical protein [Euryarchaeota archaeon]